MASVTPTIQVLLDDGTGTYPIDITSRVSLANVGVSGYGRGDEFGQATAASLSLILKNDDGLLSVGVGLGFGLGGFGLGGFGGVAGGGLLYPGQPIRYKETKGATTINAFTGRISELPLVWTGGNAKSSQVNLTAVDPLAALALRPLRSMFEEESLLLAPVALYPLSESEGVTAAAELTSRQAALTPTLNGGTYAFGTDLGLVGTSTGVTFTQSAAAGGGNSCTLSQTNGVGGTWSAASVSITVVFRQSGSLPVTTTPLAGVYLADGTGTSVLSFNSAGQALWNGCTSPANLMDGLPHVITLQAGGGLSTDMWVDKVKVATAAVKVATWSNAVVQLNGSGEANAVTTFGDFMYGPRLTDVQVSGTIHAGLIDGYAGDTTATRFARFASYVGLTTSTSVNSGTQMGAQPTAGVTAVDALMSVAAAENGVAFANGSGVLVLQGHGYRAQKTTPTLTVPMKDISASTALTWDTQQIVNQVTAARTNGISQLVANATSIATYGLYAQSLDLALAADSDVLLAAQWLVNKHSTPLQRLGSVNVNLLTSAIAEQIMAVEIGDRWSLSGMPAQAWSGFGDLSVEGYSRTLVVTESGAEWSMTLNLLPWSLFQSGVYDDAGSTYDNAVYA